MFYFLEKVVDRFRGRKPDNVYEDVINNKITYERAEKFYGVVINKKTNKIDNKRTIQKSKNK